MTDINRRILELIAQNKSMREISSELGITEKQLYIRIKQLINYGYQLEPSYSYTADVYYQIVYGFPRRDNKFSISIPKKEKIFKCLVYSDLHVGNINSAINLLNYLYEYASKNGIYYILNCGDIIEGDYTTAKKSIKDYEKQIEFLLKKYPYDKNIKNVMIFGNHDYHSLKYDGFNLSEKIKKTRYDIIPIGYGQGSVNLRNDSLIMFHKLNEDYKPKLLNNEKIILSGHGHMMKTKLKDELWICVPTLSYVSIDKTKDIIPSFVELDIYFENGLFEYVEAKQILVTPKLIPISESRCRIKKFGGIK